MYTNEKKTFVTSMMAMLLGLVFASHIDMRTFPRSFSTRNAGANATPIIQDGSGQQRYEDLILTNHMTWSIRTEYCSFIPSTKCKNL